MSVIYLDARRGMSRIPARSRHICDACGGTGVIGADALGIAGMAPSDDEEICVPCLACDGSGRLVFRVDQMNSACKSIQAAKSIQI